MTDRPQATGPSVVAETELLSLFPSYVWWSKLTPEVAQSINRNVLGALDSLVDGPVEPREGTMWQTEQTLHELDALAELCGCVKGAANAVLEFLRIPNRSFLITGCWANVTGTGAPFQPHTHPNNFLSGVYYVRAAPGGQTITFHDPRPQMNIMRPPVSELGPDNAGKIDVNIAEGCLLMFPAWLMHSVDRNRSDQVRISVSFNLMFEHYGETMGQPLWTGSVPVTRERTT